MADDSNPPPLDPDERFRLKLLAVSLADKLQREAAKLPEPLWRSWAALRLREALETELRRMPPKR